MQGHISETERDCVLTGNSHFGTDVTGSYISIDQRRVAYKYVKIYSI